MRYGIEARKFLARHTLQRHVREGRVVRMPCEVCGNAKTQAHHADYGKPLDVRWLCQKHHNDLHKGVPFRTVNPACYHRHQCIEYRLPEGVSYSLQTRLCREGLRPAGDTDSQRWVGTNWHSCDEVYAHEAWTTDSNRAGRAAMPTRVTMPCE